jgi:hypothetical protein
MFWLDKKKTTTLSDELFGKQNLAEINIYCAFKGYCKWIRANIKYQQWSLEWVKRIKGESLSELLDKIELFVNEIK